MHFAELDIMRWVHIICMVYWLGGEWGVFQTSYNITNLSLSLEERRRHLETLIASTYWRAPASFSCCRSACTWAPSMALSPRLKGI